MTTALVTGGAGFIGSHLVRRLVREGVDVTVLDDLSTGPGENLKGVACRLMIDDVRSEKAVQSAVRDKDWVFHLAAMVSVPRSIEDPITCYDINLMGSLHVLRAARASKAGRVVLSSSCAVYGNTSGPVKETAEEQPLSPYAASKWAMEVAGRVFAHAFDLPVVSLRYFNVYGPRQSPESDYAAVIPVFIQTLLEGKQPTIDGDGRQTRDFVFVEDVVQANWLAATRFEAVGGVFNVGGGKSISVLALAQSLQRVFKGAPELAFGPRRQGDIQHSEADLSSAARSLGYRPAIGLEAGLEKTIEWFELNSRQVAP